MSTDNVMIAEDKGQVGHRHLLENPVIYSVPLNIPLGSLIFHLGELSGMYSGIVRSS